uniref:Orf149 n=1 Tax=Flammulina velutipes TaxID=38945 RepID=A0A0A0MZH2_FLAVE|nr:orf149 [Flammulina velutipes]
MCNLNKYYNIFSVNIFKVIFKYIKNQIIKINIFNLTIKNTFISVTPLTIIKTNILIDYNYYININNLKIESLQFFSIYPFLFFRLSNKKNYINNKKLHKILSYKFNFQFKKYLQIFKNIYNIFFVINVIYIFINVIGIICFGFFLNFKF